VPVTCVSLCFFFLINRVQESRCFVLKDCYFQPKAETQLSSSQPITHPLYGSASTNNGYGQEAPPPQVFQPTPATNYGQANSYGQTNSYGQLPTTFNPTGFKPNAVNFNQAQNQANVVPEKPQPIQKPPIPEEHIHMQTVFDELKYQCSCAANNPVSNCIVIGRVSTVLCFLSAN
jgi:hypothetical protein